MDLPFEHKQSHGFGESIKGAFDDAYDISLDTAAKHPAIPLAIAGGALMSTALYLMGSKKYIPIILLCTAAEVIAASKIKDKTDNGDSQSNSQPNPGDNSHHDNTRHDDQPNDPARSIAQSDSSGQTPVVPDNAGGQSPGADNQAPQGPKPQRSPMLSPIAFGQSNGQYGSFSTDVPVLHGDPNQIPPDYPGGIGPDAAQLGRAMRAAGPFPSSLYQLFMQTYNSRANEDWLPANLPLHEISPEAKPHIAQWHLMGDRALYNGDPKLGNRDLKPIADRLDSPGSSKNPGHMYAFGVDRNGLPVDVLEYYRDTHNNINYYRQYLISYTKDRSGDTVVDVSDYMASNQTQTYGPQKNIAGVNHTLMGVTRYYESPDNSCLRAERYAANNLDKPMYAVNFDNKTRSAGTLSPQFYFYDLFGP